MEMSVFVYFSQTDQHACAQSQPTTSLVSHTPGNDPRSNTMTPFSQWGGNQITVIGQRKLPARPHWHLWTIPVQRQWHAQSTSTHVHKANQPRASLRSQTPIQRQSHPSLNGGGGQSDHCDWPEEAACPPTLAPVNDPRSKTMTPFSQWGAIRSLWLARGSCLPCPRPPLLQVQQVHGKQLHLRALCLQSKCLSLSVSLSVCITHCTVDVL